MDADLNEAQLQGASLEFAQLQGAIRSGAQCFEVYFEEAPMQGANLAVRVSAKGTVELCKVTAREAHVRADAGGKNLFQRSLMQNTEIVSADFTGAMFRRVDLSPLNISAEQLNTAFGDGSVTLPDHIDWPAHWPRESVDYDEFEKQWRAFLATLPPGWDAPKR